MFVPADLPAGQHDRDGAPESCSGALCASEWREPCLALGWATIIFLRLGFVEQVNLLQELVFKLPVVQPQAIYEPFWTLSLPKACPRWVLAYKPNEKGLP